MIPIDLNSDSHFPYHESIHSAAFADNLTGAANIPGEFGHHCRNAAPANAEQEDDNIQRTLAISLLTAPEDEQFRQALAESQLTAIEEAQLCQAKAASRLTTIEEAQLCQAKAASRLTTVEEELRQALAESQITAIVDEQHRQALAANQFTAVEEELRQALAESLAIADELPATPPDLPFIIQAQDMSSLKAYLAATGYRIRDSDGNGNNCLFYSIVQCILPPDTDKEFVAQDAAELRRQYDIRKPGNEGQGLFFDNNQAENQAGLQDSDNASVITDLVCRFYDFDVQIELIVAPISQDGQPYISMGKYRRKQPVSPEPERHIRVLDTYGHYKSIIQDPTAA